MLTQLTISNFGLIDRLSLEFTPQLNILTGETGAGKSIIIDALRAALGDRINASQLKDASKPCTIEAIFEIKDKQLRKSELLADYIQEDNQLVIQRTLTPDSKHKIKINGFTLTVSQLKDIGKYLIDFHGAHDHQLLLDAARHIEILDKLSDLTEELEKYSEVFIQYAQLRKQWNDLQELKNSSAREVDLLSHQIKELEQFPLDDQHLEDLLQEQKRINNSEKLNDSAALLLNYLNAAGESIRQSFSSMRHLNQLDDSTIKLDNQLQQIQIMTDQLTSELDDYAATLAFEPNRANDINKQCDLYDDIKRKYGPTLLDAKSYYEEAKEKYSMIINIEHNESEIQNMIAASKKDLKKRADQITQKRQKTSLELKKTIEKELKELGIVNVKFESRVEFIEFHQTGQDHVTFFISPNAGEELKPLADIVSSGEAARVMLALKKALINVDPIPVLIFDEIDAQIGGRLGTITGEKLKEISAKRQVILITHLPQIASFGNRHFKVIKTVRANKTFTEVLLLDKDERIKELAQMMSGEETTTIALKHAQDMLKQARTNGTKKPVDQ